MFILTRSRILGECLPGVWCLTFVLPKLSSFCFREETSWLLPDKHTVRIISQMVICFFLNRNYGFVCSWSWSKASFFLIFAVWNVTLENFVLSRRIELLLTHLIEIINARSWILCPALVIVSEVGLFKQLSIDLRGCEIEFRISLPNCWLFWIISSWTHLIEANPSIGSLSQFLRGNTWSFGIWNDC